MKPTIVFVSRKITRGFMTTDMELMRPYVNVMPLDLTGPRPTRPRFFARLLNALLAHRARAVFAYFVSREYTPHMALLLRALGRKLLIATGGTDSTYIEDIQFGELRTASDRRRFAWTMALADSVLAFSDSAREEVLRFGRPRRIRTAHMSVDTDQFRLGPATRPPRAVTVGAAVSRYAMLQKGIEPFVQAAELAPEVEFVVVGRCVDAAARDLRERSPSNVRFVDRFLEPAEYVEQLQSAAVYVQASGHEGFGVCLAEAMACGCVPVVANRYSLPEVVGETGILVPFNDPAALAAGVRRALGEPERGVAARRRVAELFTPQRRQRVILRELEAVLGPLEGDPSGVV